MSIYTEQVAKKINELVEEHGREIEESLRSGKLPLNQLDNFFGRHPERRCLILSLMQNGLSYSRAYQESEGCFDTKHWGKIANRTASCRGLLLKSTAGLFVLGETVRSQPQFTQLETIALELATEAKRLLRKVVHYEFAVAPKPPKKRRSGKTQPINSPDVTFNQVLSNLKTAMSKLKKNTRDVSQMAEKLGTLPSVDEVAKTAIEVGRLLCGVQFLLAALETGCIPVSTNHRAKDVLGIGEEYSCWFRDVALVTGTRKRIATHTRPDADALVSAWLTDRFLFPNDRCQVEFVARSPLSQDNHDAVVDMGGRHDPTCLVFDHKPPAFPHRDEECASSLVWKHAQSLGCPVDHLESLVELVHDGDAITRRPRSQAYAQSRTNGLHAIINHAKGYSESDPMLYQGIAAFLDARYLKSRVQRRMDQHVCDTP
ncbi:MAG: hypothetical protein KDA84_22690 [Planctomycetaceae bacterium]|nr:hypothetical protein [Planctomycetaceae bacterium]